MQTEVWAHRGSSHKFIENSLAAFKQAVEDGADGIELDVQRTKDGQLVVIHDEKLQRLTASSHYLWELNFEELSELKLIAPHFASSEQSQDNIQIPLLEDVLKLMKESHLTVNIELKNSIHLYEGMEEEVVALVEKLEMQDQVVYSSFNHVSVNRLSNLTSSQNTGLLTSDIAYQPWNYLKQLGAGAFHCMLNSLQEKDLINKCHEHGIKVHVWTADDEAYINLSLLLKVDAIITNVPDVAIKLRQQFIEDGGKAALESVTALGFNIGG